MKKKTKLIISMIVVMMILVLGVEYVFAKNKKLKKNVENDINISTKKAAISNTQKGIGTETQQLDIEKIDRMIEKYFPKDIEKAYGYREKEFIKKDLDPEIKHEGTQTVMNAPTLVENEIITTYSNGFMGKVVIFKKIGEEYTPVWESPLRYMGYYIMVEEVRDINNDGLKEIIIYGAVGARGYPGIWIYSWDGSSGKLISSTWHEGRSTEFVSSAGFDVKDDIKDIDGDKIDEVIIHRYILNPEGGPDPIGVDKEIYKWNPTNQMYELWKTELESGKRRDKQDNLE